MGGGGRASHTTGKRGGKRKEEEKRGKVGGGPTDRPTDGGSFLQLWQRQRASCTGKEGEAVAGGGEGEEESVIVAQYRTFCPLPLSPAKLPSTTVAVFLFFLANRVGKWQIVAPFLSRKSSPAFSPFPLRI